MGLLALGMAVGALALLIVGLSMIFKGRVAVGLVVGMLALVVGGAAGSLAAFA
jgi:hypothetical protein